MYHILVDRGVVLHVLTPARLSVSKESLADKLLGGYSLSRYCIIIHVPYLIISLINTQITHLHLS